jgi:hypothetical protein
MCRGRRPEDDNPFAKYNYTRRKRQSDVWLRLARVGGIVLFCGLLLLLYKSVTFRSRAGVSYSKVHHKHVDDENIVRENATLVMLVRYIHHPYSPPRQAVLSEGRGELLLTVYAGVEIENWMMRCGRCDRLKTDSIINSIIPGSSSTTSHSRRNSAF